MADIVANEQQAIASCDQPKSLSCDQPSSVSCDQPSLSCDQPSSQSCDQPTSVSDDNSNLSQAVHEYETQFFGFTPGAFINGVHNALIEYLYEGMDSVEKYLIKECNITEGSKVSIETVRAGSHKIFARLKKQYADAFDKLEMYLNQNLLHIPSHVVLPEDKVNQDFHFTLEDEETLDEELNELSQKIRNLKYVNKCLIQAMKDMDQVQSKMDNLMAMIEKIEKIHKDAGVADLKETMAFNIDKVNKMKKMIEQIVIHAAENKVLPEQDKNGNKQRSKRQRVV